MKKILTFIIISFLFCACQQEKEVYYYSEKGDNISQEFELKNGVRNGKARGYFESGKLQSEAYFENGEAEGEFIYYYENGNIEVEGTFKNGVETGTTKHYFENGVLHTEEFRNENGKVFDFKAYRTDGKRDTTFESKRVLFIAKKDTINVGEEYSAEIRLGNRQYNSTKIIIGDPRDKNILRYEFLPRKDSLTSLINVKATKEGENLVEGVALDLLVKNGDIDSVMVIPFRHTFFVK